MNVYHNICSYVARQKFIKIMEYEADQNVHCIMFMSQYVILRKCSLYKLVQ